VAGKIKVGGIDNERGREEELELLLELACIGTETARDLSMGTALNCGPSADDAEEEEDEEDDECEEAEES